MSYGQQSAYGGGYGQKQQSAQKAQLKREYPVPKTFDEAKNHKINFGKHKGATLNQVAGTDDGLSYLVWLNNSINERFEDTCAALDIFLTDPRVAADVAANEEARAKR